MNETNLLKNSKWKMHLQKIRMHHKSVQQEWLKFVLTKKGRSVCNGNVTQHELKLNL